MKLKVTLICYMILLTFNLHTTNAMASTLINVTINGQTIDYSDEYGFPFTDENNQTLVPFRKSVEFFGGEVRWDSEYNMAVATYQNTTVKIPIDKDFIIVNGSEIPNYTNSVIIDGRTYCSIERVFKAFDFSVCLDYTTSTITVKTYIESEPITSELLEDWIPFYIFYDDTIESNPYEFSLKSSEIYTNNSVTNNEYIIYNASKEHTLYGLESYFLLHEYGDWIVRFNDIRIMNKQGYLLFNRTDLKELGFLK